MNATKYALITAAALLVGNLALAQQPPGDGQPRMSIEERFKAADKNGDGKISRDEAKEGLGRMANRFDEIDTNKDGFLTLDELKNAPRPQRGTGAPGGAAPAQ